MVFSSFVFLLAFLPIVLLLYYLCPARLRNLVLLVFSLVFYAWGEPVYVLIMLFSIVFDYANGRLIEHFKNKNCPGKAKAALIVDLCGNLAILGFFKYTDFVIGSINSITGAGLKPGRKMGVVTAAYSTSDWNFFLYLSDNVLYD